MSASGARTRGPNPRETGNSTSVPTAPHPPRAFVRADPRVVQYAASERRVRQEGARAKSDGRHGAATPAPSSITSRRRIADSRLLRSRRRNSAEAIAVVIAVGEVVSYRSRILDERGYSKRACPCMGVCACQSTGRVLQYSSRPGTL